jgi:hypothetical protein
LAVGNSCLYRSDFYDLILTCEVRPSLRQAITTPKETAQAPPELLPPTVLVFRDGRQEDVKKYTIIGSVIYASEDYWTTGSWTTEIPMAWLDIPATLKVNAEHGGKFNLPSGPNEIVIRF